MTDFEGKTGGFHSSAVAVGAGFRVEERGGRYWIVRTVAGVDSWLTDWPTQYAAEIALGQMKRKNATARRNSRAKAREPKNPVKDPNRRLF